MDSKYIVGTRNGLYLIDFLPQKSCKSPQICHLLLPVLSKL